MSGAFLPLHPTFTHDEKAAEYNPPIAGTQLVRPGRATGGRQQLKENFGRLGIPYRLTCS